MNTFDIKEVRKLVLASGCICSIVAGSIGYYFGSTTDQAQYFKKKIAEEKEYPRKLEQLRQSLIEERRQKISNKTYEELVKESKEKDFSNYFKR